MDFITIDVAKREALGTANSNRLRREDHVPAVLYGMKRPNIELSIARRELVRFLRTGSHLVELALGEKARPAILREIQVDHTTDRILHVDFVRVDADHEVETDVPLNWHGRAAGESEGGVFTAYRDSVTVRAKPKDLPRQFTVEIAGLKLDDAVALADLAQHANVEFLEPLDTVIAVCSVPKEVVEEVDEATEEAAAEDGAAAAEPAGE